MERLDETPLSCTLEIRKGAVVALYTVVVAKYGRLERVGWPRVVTASPLARNPSIRHATRRHGTLTAV